MCKSRFCRKGFLVLLCAMLLFGFHHVTGAKAAPTAYPDVIEGLDFGGQTVYIYDWWSNDDAGHSSRKTDATEDEQKRYDYIDWLEATYNVKIVNTAWDKGGWSESPQELAKMAKSGHADELCCIIIDPNFVGEPMGEGLLETWTIDTSGSQWLSSVTDLMTVGNNVYGVCAGEQEPREEIFFNKKVLEDAGIDCNEIYDLAAKGEWTWAKFEEYMAKVQKDTDNDGVIDTWALTGSGDRLFRGCVYGNNATLFDTDASGQLIVTANSDKALKGIAQRQEWEQKYMPQKDDIAPDGEWNWFEGFWKQGTTAFYIGQNYEGFASESSLMRTCDFEWGCVPFPKGPDADDYYYAANNNVVCIPTNCYDAETVKKIEEIYALYTYPTPGVDPETSWIGDKYTYADEKAVDITLALLRDPKRAVGNKTYLLGDENTVLGGTLMWNLGDGTAEEVVQEAMPALQELCDAYNALSLERKVLVNDFVSRCYSVILGRSVDAEGLAGWSAALTGGTAAASQIIDGIVSSQEYANKNLSNEDSVKVLYQAMLGRDPDADGLAAWTAVLDQGYPFGSVINGFCASNEFTALCNSYGIQPGSVNVGPITPKPDDDSPRGKIEAFVKRCYQLILGREADAGGLQGWSDALESNTATAAQIIDGFVRSPEFINRNLSDADSVDILYKTMLSREADEGGKAGWVQVLAQGNSYATVINGFCGSEEFATLCNEYGITPGSITLMSGFYIGEAACLNEEKVTAFVQQNYSAVLGRDADEQGLEDYTRALMNYLETPQQVIHDFIFSPEYQEQLPGNEAFITTLYQAYLGREPDPEGLAVWVQKLEDGTSLEEIVNGFAGSAEFKTIVNSMKE